MSQNKILTPQFVLFIWGIFRGGGNPIFCHSPRPCPPPPIKNPEPGVGVNMYLKLLMSMSFVQNNCFPLFLWCSMRGENIYIFVLFDIYLEFTKPGN